MISWKLVKKFVGCSRFCASHCKYYNTVSFFFFFDLTAFFFFLIRFREPGGFFNPAFIRHPEFNRENTVHELDFKTTFAVESFAGNFPAVL